MKLTNATEARHTCGGGTIGTHVSPMLIPTSMLLCRKSVLAENARTM